MFLARCRAMPIWTTTAPGARNRITVRFGIRARSTLAGLPIATAIGTTLDPGAGRGWTILPGALRRITTVAGRSLAAAGAGARVLTTPVRSMALPLLAFSAVAAAVSEI